LGALPPTLPLVFYCFGGAKDHERPDVGITPLKILESHLCQSWEKIHNSKRETIAHWAFFTP
jgi:hypothetical protein